MEGKLEIRVVAKPAVDRREPERRPSPGATKLERTKSILKQGSRERESAAAGDNPQSPKREAISFAPEYELERRKLEKRISMECELALKNAQEQEERAQEAPGPGTAVGEVEGDENADDKEEEREESEEGEDREKDGAAGAEAADEAKRNAGKEEAARIGKDEKEESASTETNDRRKASCKGDSMARIKNSLDVNR